MANGAHGALERSGKAPACVTILVEQVKRHALCRLGADAREALERLYELVQKGRVNVGHVV